MAVNVANAGDVEIEIVKLLLSAGADPSKLNGEGRSPLHVAVRSCFTDAVVSLLESPLIDIDCISDSGKNHVNFTNLANLNIAISSIISLQFVC